jgi:hypothetical protein
MRRIIIERWNVKGADNNDVEENTLMLLNALINATNPAELPKGLDHFRTFNRLSKSFDSAEKNGLLELEEVDYLFLKRLTENNIPSIWGMSLPITKAIESFLNAKQE